MTTTRIIKSVSAQAVNLRTLASMEEGTPTTPRMLATLRPRTVATTPRMAMAEVVPWRLLLPRRSMGTGQVRPAVPLLTTCLRHLLLLLLLLARTPVSRTRILLITVRGIKGRAVATRSHPTFPPSLTQTTLLVLLHPAQDSTIRAGELSGTLAMVLLHLRVLGTHGTCATPETCAIPVRCVILETCSPVRCLSPVIPARCRCPATPAKCLFIGTLGS